jgi:hypothetical protein
VLAALYNRGIDNISSNIFLSCLSSIFLNGFHLHTSISDAILNEGTVSTHEHYGKLFNLKSRIPSQEGLLAHRLLK